VPASEAFLDTPVLQRYGLPERILGTSPVVATDFTQTVDGAFYARLVGVFVRLVTDGNAANRQVVVEYRDQGANRYDVSGPNATQAATLTVDYCFSAYAPEEKTAVDGTTIVPLHPLLLLPTDSFRIHVANVQVGDQLSRIRFTWERFYSDVRLPGHDPDDF
jgi:hypothetical protein